MQQQKYPAIKQVVGIARMILNKEKFVYHGGLKTYFLKGKEVRKMSPHVYCRGKQYYFEHLKKAQMLLKLVRAEKLKQGFGPEVTLKEFFYAEFAAYL